jgi:hypothetical protein
MRYSEIRRALRESETDYSAFVEDDADNHCADILSGVLQNIIFSADHAEIPKIRVDALIHLVRNAPGGEAFNAESLKSCQQNDDNIKNLIDNIKDDANGVKYVYLNREDPFGADPIEGPAGSDDEASKSAPEKTVSSMAKRAAGARS